MNRYYKLQQLLMSMQLQYALDTIKIDTIISYNEQSHKSECNGNMLIISKLGNRF